MSEDPLPGCPTPKLIVGDSHTGAGITEIIGFTKSASSTSRTLSPSIARKSFVSPLFDVIPDAFESKSLPSIPVSVSSHRCSSPCSLFHRLSPPATRSATKTSSKKSGADSVIFLEKKLGEREESGETCSTSGLRLDCKPDENNLTPGGGKRLTWKTKMPSSVDETFEARQVNANVHADPFATRGRMNDRSSQNRVLIKGGRCVNDDQMFDADVYIEDGIIKQIGPHLVVPGGIRVVEARGQYVMPGGIDPHTHMQFPFMGTRTIDDFYSGTKAALAGGTTMIIDFAIGGDGSLIESYQRWRNWADEKVCCDYGLHVAITKWKDGVTEREMDTLVKEKGVNSFKFFMAYKKEGMMLENADIIKLMDNCKSIGAVPMVHAENGEAIDYLTKKLLRLGVTGPEGHLQSRPEEIEGEATHRAATLANQVGAPLYVVHVMSKSAAEEVMRARARGDVITGEALACGVGTDGTNYFNRCWRHAAGHILSPPLRADKGTPEYLMNLLSSGQLEVVGSDHCTFSAQQKAMGQNDFSKIPNGVNGVEERLMVVWEKGVKTGKIDPCKFVAITSSNAARIFNVYPRKGKIAVGSDADLVVWGKKPRKLTASTHNSLADFNVFEGMHVEFSPIAVIANGKVVLDEDGKLHVSQGAGRFVPTPPFPNVYYSRLIEREVNMGPIKVDRSSPEKAPEKQTNGAPTTLSVETQIMPAKQVDVAGTPPPMNPPSPVPSVASVASSGAMTPTGFHRIQTRSGVRNLQDSSFKLTGEQIDDDRAGRTAIKVHNPPGGKSHGLW